MKEPLPGDICVLSLLLALGCAFAVLVSTRWTTGRLAGNSQKDSKSINVNFDIK